MPRLQLCLPFDAWPEGDRQLWMAATAPGPRRFTAARPAERLSPRTIYKTQGGYGRWLGFLAARGWLDTTAAPAARVTQDAVAAWLNDLKAQGNADHTIVGRLGELQRALRLLAPGVSFGWLTRPGGVPIRARLPMRRRAIEVHHPKAMFDWGLALVEKAKRSSGDDRRRVMLRDGVMIALLAARAPRLRSLAALRLGSNVRREREGWRIDFDERDVKTAKPLSYGLPAALDAAMDRYVEVERAELLAGATEDALWIGWDGKPMGLRGIEKRVRWRSAKRFGAAGSFGPHRFRYGIASMGPAEDPVAPVAGASILGITHGTFRQAYDRGARAAAAKRFHDGLQAARKETTNLARNLYARRRGDGEEGTS